MGNLFSIDGPLYKIFKVIYQLLILNFLWLIFSIPLVTIGASTTALFYITDKIIRGEYKNYLLKPFWQSFKNNFKQASIIWLMLVVGFIVISINIRNLYLLGNLSKYIAIVQFFILIELVIVGIYIFPLLARHHITVINGFKAAFFIAHRHIITTILCIAVFPGLYYLLMWEGYFILFIMSIYSFWIMYLIRDKFSRYAESE